MASTAQPCSITSNVCVTKFEVQETLAVARRRSGRFRSRCSGAKPPQRQGGKAPNAKALKGSRPHAACDDHRQAALLRRRCLERRSHKGLNNRAENSRQPIRRRERIMKRFKSRRHLQRFVSVHDAIANLFNIPRHDISSRHHRVVRTAAMDQWAKIAQALTANKTGARVWTCGS